MARHSLRLLRAALLAATALTLISCSGGGGGNLLGGGSGSSPSAASDSGGGGTTGGGTTGGSSGGVTLLAGVTTPTAQLVRDAVETVGDASLVVGGTTDTAGSLLPGGLGGSVVVLGRNLDATGNQVRSMGDTLEATLLRVAVLDLSPLLGTGGLLTPILSDVGQTLRPLAGRSGELGAVTGSVWVTAWNVVNRLPNSGLANLLQALLNPVLAPLVAGPPSRGLLVGLLGNSNLLSGLPNRVGQTSPVNGTLNIGGVVTPVTGTITAGTVLRPVTNTTTGLLGAPSSTGTPGSNGGLLNGVLHR